MGKTLAEKILDAHLISGGKKGERAYIKIDQALTQDATGTFAYLELESLGIDRVKCDLAVSYVDHNTMSQGSENSDDHVYLESVAKRYGIVYSPQGNGICHSLHTERFSKPGVTILGSDSHTPTSSALGAIAIGAGGLSVASAMAGLPFELVYPRIIEIRLSGKLSKGVSAKDVILDVLSHFGVTGNQNTIFEYTGEGVKTLSVMQRATICNMGAECGVTTSLFPADENTKKFLKEQGREKDYKPMAADKDAKYDGLYEIDLSKLEPLVALPHSPGNVKKVKDIRGLEVNQVLIGSCTNSSLEDLSAVAEIFKGKHVKEGVECAISTGSRNTTLSLIKSGAMEIFINAGVRIMESTCGFCIGSGLSPQTKGVSLRTNNRNFEGRSGTESAEVYLVSPETAASSAITGVLTLPTLTPPKPSKYILGKNHFISEYDSKEVVKRPPSIGVFPTFSPLPDSLSLNIGLVVGDKITTDHIMPAGQRLKFRSNPDKYASFVFEGVDKDFASVTKANKEKGIYTAIVAGLSYGQGSSREHAAICPRYLGVRVIIAESIERIHSANLYNFGIIPLILDNNEDKNLLEKGQTIKINNIHESLKTGSFVVECGDKKIRCHIDASEKQKEALLKGSLINILKEQIQNS